MPIYIETSPRATRIERGLSQQRTVNRKEKTPYQKLLASPEWKGKRLECLAAHARNKQVCCFTCGRPRENNQLRIHHLRYPDRGERLDPLVDLVPVCPKCHIIIHSSENEHLRVSGITKGELQVQMRTLFAARKKLKKEAYEKAHPLGERGKKRKAYEAWLKEQGLRPSRESYAKFCGD